MNAQYSPLPTSATANGYPPGQPQSQAILSRLSPTAPPTRIRRVLVFIAVLGLSSLLVVYIFFSPSSISSHFPSILSGSSRLPSAGYSYADPGDSSSPWFRDPHPALHARLFLARAQAEIKARGLDSCDGKLSGRMVEGYIDAAMPYCAATSKSHDASITCFPVRAPNSPNSWWPYPQAFCASQNLAHTQGWGGDGGGRIGGTFTGQCAITDAGRQLKVDMGREAFLGTEFTEAPEGGAETTCGETIVHPVLFVPRQDQWNPFHVGEDLVTTFLALMLFSRHAAPDATLWTGLPAAYAAGDGEFVQMRQKLERELEGTAGLQLIFQDAQLPTQSLFAPMYDRIGAWPARRTAADALGADGSSTCFTTAFHSVGAGASLLSGTGVGKRFPCASELVWGASLWLRWLWGLERGVPGGAYVRDSEAEDTEGDVYGAYRRAVLDAEVEVERRAPVDARGGEPLNVLFLSREKFDAYTKHKKTSLSGWQEARHITNEHELVAGLRTGLAGLCRAVTPVPGGRKSEAHTPGSVDCTYTDADMLPDAWGAPMHPREARALGIRRGSGSAHVASEHAEVAPPAPGDDEGSAIARRLSHPHSRPRSLSAHNTTKRAPSSSGSGRPLRFATLDPTTTALASQLGTVGRMDVVVSVHAGALGLTLFMPTGRASVIELIPSGAYGNEHFHNMAHMMGMEYLHLDVQRKVDVGAVVKAVRGLVERRLKE